MDRSLRFLLFFILLILLNLLTRIVTAFHLIIYCRFQINLPCSPIPRRGHRRHGLPPRPRPERGAGDRGQADAQDRGAEPPAHDRRDHGAVPREDGRRRRHDQQADLRPLRHRR